MDREGKRRGTRGEGRLVRGGRRGERRVRNAPTHERFLEPLCGGSGPLYHHQASADHALGALALQPPRDWERGGQGGRERGGEVEGTRGGGTRRNEGIKGGKGGGGGRDGERKGMLTTPSCRLDHGPPF